MALKFRKVLRIPSRVNAYIDKSKEYGQKAQSVISTLLLSDEKDRQALLESEAEHKKALLEAFSDESVSHKVLLNGSPLLEKNRQKRVRQAISRCFLNLIAQMMN